MSSLESRTGFFALSGADASVRVRREMKNVKAVKSAAIESAGAVIPGSIGSIRVSAKLVRLSLLIAVLLLITAGCG